VIDGMETVKQIEALGSSSGKTQSKISIAESGDVANNPQ
jgi:hypothetical protein